MSKLLLPDFKPGMIVVTPSKNIRSLTEDKKYMVLDYEEDWIQIQDDDSEIRFYQAHLFIEADVYYNMIFWLILMRMFDIDPKDM